ncbi:glycosyltransferase family 2 protein [Thermococcus sp. AM4]|uniref:glycosyltransferase family 2 protein n=1 Tax=Thermococcus sp. (strain AM4) TaxID=246969 RepID=UPI00018710EC|nr:glycosyltransferase family 2 protein [Thermococcus sp. AM4]EEB73891.1 glycosyltransferase [Thermococcus sp. AM4]
MGRPKISIILPTYNRGYIIGRTIRSVLDQTFKDFELIIIDDGSTDNTKNIVEIYKEKDNRIRYIRHKRNLGANAARNTGIKKSRGEYIAFIDSDTIWKPQKLEIQIKIADNTKENFVIYSRTIRKYTKKTVIVPEDVNQGKKEGQLLDKILVLNFIDMSSILVKKNMIKNSGLFDEKLPRLQDWDILIRLAEKYNFVYIPQTLVISYVLSDSISVDYCKLLKAEMHLLKKYYPLFKQDKRAIAQRYYEIVLSSLKCKRMIQTNHLRGFIKYLPHLDRSLVRSAFILKEILHNRATIKNSEIREDPLF